MSGFRCSEEDQFLDDIDLEVIAAMEAKELSKHDLTISTTANTTANSANLDGFGDDDDDDEILIIGEKLSAQANCNGNNTATSIADFIVKKDQAKSRGPAFKVEPQPQPPKKDIIANKRNVFEGKDDDWKGFVRWFDNQEMFDTPWFLTIPITRLTISQCESIVGSCSDVGHLVQFAKLLVSILKDGVGDDQGVENGNVKDVIGVMEKLFLRLEDFKFNCSPQLNSQANELYAVYEDVLDAYMSGKYNLIGTRIPELLISLHPKSFEDLMCQALKRDQVDLLLPICEKSAENFLKIMQCLHSSDICSKAGIERDPDFQAYKSNPTHKLAVNLLKSLEEKMGTRFLQILPTQFQPIFNFDSVISKNIKKYHNNEKIICEVFSILNDLFCGCARENWKDWEYIKFILSLFPFTSSILKDSKLVQTIEFKKYPYLYLYIRRSR